MPDLVIFNYDMMSDSDGDPVTDNTSDVSVKKEKDMRGQPEKLATQS